MLQQKYVAEEEWKSWAYVLGVAEIKRAWGCRHFVSPDLLEDTMTGSEACLPSGAWDLRQRPQASCLLALRLT